MKKKTVLLLLAAICLTILFGCATQPEIETQQPEIETQPLSEVSVIPSAIVIGNAEKGYVRAIATSVNTLINAENQIYTVANAPDAAMRIYIGDPQELQLDALIEEVPYFGYLVTVRDGDLYILSYHDKALEEVSMTILKKISSWYSKKAIVVPDDYELISTVSADFPHADIPHLEGAKEVTGHDYDNDHRVIAMQDVSAEEFDAYCAKLAAEGYTLHVENEIGGNRFLTYTNEAGMMLHTYRIAYSNEARIITAETDLLPFVSNADVESVCTPLLNQMGGGDEMGYIIRLADGRFIIIDGGHENTGSEDDIYIFLKRNAPDPEHIEIAAWFITHAHIDHCGGIMEFAKKHASKSSISIQCFMFNPCETEEQMEHCVSSRNVLCRTLATYYPDVPIYKPLTGQIFTFGKTTIEILYTMSDFIPNTIAYEPDGKGGDYNVMTTVSMIDIDSTADLGDKFFVMGDTTTVACNEMSKRYGDAMKCDFVQVSHHGFSPLPTGLNCRRNGATIEIYDLIDPDIALWPAAAKYIAERSELEINAHFISIVDEVVIAGRGARTFEFSE